MNFNVLCPTSKEDLLKIISENQGGNFRFGAGYTDLIMELKKQTPEGLTVINLAQLKDDEFTGISECKDGLRIGALASANSVIADITIKEGYPVLHSASSKLVDSFTDALPDVSEYHSISSTVKLADISSSLISLSIFTIGGPLFRGRRLWKQVG